MSDKPKHRKGIKMDGYSLICDLKKSSADEKKEIILGMIRGKQHTAKDIICETGLAEATVYNYLNQLENESLIVKEGTVYTAKIMDNLFDNNSYLEYLLPRILSDVKVKKILTVNEVALDEWADDEEEIFQNEFLHTILIKFNRRGCEQNVAEVLYDAFFEEIHSITISVGGLIIYLDKNYSSDADIKIYRYLKKCIPPKNGWKSLI